jgi:hypothetical protein
MNQIFCPICKSQTDFLVAKQDRFSQQYAYVVCRSCRFLFEKDLAQDAEGLAKKVASIYQKDYFESTDTGWKMRGDGFLKIIKAAALLHRFVTLKKNPTILDYGGGNGYLASKLGQDFTVFYYDAFEKPSIPGEYRIVEKPVKADIMYAVELVEHLTDITQWDFLQTLKPDMFVFTTCLSDNITEKNLLSWSYLNPDSGHTAIYSHQSLYLLGKKYGFLYLFFPNIATHVFLKNKLLSKIHFVAVEYFLYSLVRKVKRIFSK